jgi:hypothetical protein
MRMLQNTDMDTRASTRFLLGASAFAVALVLDCQAAAQPFKKLHSFTRTYDSSNPTSRIRGVRELQVLANEAGDPKGLHYRLLVGQRS